MGVSRKPRQGCGWFSPSLSVTFSASASKSMESAIYSAKGMPCACTRGTKRKRTTMHHDGGKRNNSLRRVCGEQASGYAMTRLTGRRGQTSGRHHNPPSHGKSGVQAQASAACMQENLLSHDASHPHSENDGKCVLTGFYVPFRQNTQLDFRLQSRRVRCSRHQ